MLNSDRSLFGIGIRMSAHIIICWVMTFSTAECRVLAHELRLTRFDDLLGSVTSDHEQAQRDFIAVALDVMIDAYLIEVKRVDELGAKSTAKQSSWRSGTMGYVRRLERSLQAADDGAQIFIAQEADGSLRFVVDGEQIMFHAPRLSGQGQLESTLVDQYCMREYCEHRSETIEEETRKQMDSFSGHWEFSSGSKPTYTAGDGLKCVFEDQRHLTLKRQACKSLIFELRFLAEALKALRAKGARIDWDRITIGGAADAEPNKVSYNRRNEFFHARLPSLWATQETVRKAIPWLQARTLGNVSSFTIRPPDIVTYSSR
ncbi:MAG: hypothetical protein ACU84Q_11570 [Gammaproteobacteria bacterium]